MNDFKVLKYPSIDSFKNFYHSVKMVSEFVSKDDETGDVVYDKSKPKPKLTCVGTVKLHGTNASVVLSPAGEVYAQSKKQLIRIGQDNAGFAAYVNEFKGEFKKLLLYIDKEVDQYVAIYGEWVGKGVNKGCAIHNLEDKIFVVFGVKICDSAGEFIRWLTLDEMKNIKNNEIRCYNVMDYKTYSFDINFNDKLGSEEILNKAMLEVEKECPIAKEFGFSGIGEGLVFYTEFKGELSRFKVKGDKHAKCQSEKKEVSPEQLALLDTKNQMVLQVLPDWRLEQGLVEVFDINNGGYLDVKRMGEYLKWVVQDVAKEESFTLNEKGYKVKDISKQISDKARSFFFSQI